MGEKPLEPKTNSLTNIYPDQTGRVDNNNGASRRSHCFSEFRERKRPPTDSDFTRAVLTGRREEHLADENVAITKHDYRLKNTVKLIQAINAIQDMKLLAEESSSEVWDI